MLPRSKGEKQSTPRTVPMQVLALGFPRTGTTSLKIALETLGYVRTNHGFSIYSSPVELNMWIRAIKAKFYGEGTPYGLEEWDRLLGDCMAVTDTPHVLFAKELLAAYPDTKVVLTNRSPESWWNSYQATIAEAMKPTLRSRLNRQLQELARLIFAALFGTDHATEQIAKARFIAHYEEVRSLVPQERLLEFNVKDGWVPLATFLSKDVPEVAFPRVNDTEQFKKKFDKKKRQSAAQIS
ncbi:P-loop containing nucleoside triphosphate hydrolase protein [Mycena rebaudengoi]|nr:P-loop containing nucleoside triphosphate hydrolase protein [Mycena rebaudengoi]